MDDPKEGKQLDELIKQAYGALAKGDRTQAWDIASTAAFRYPEDERPLLILAAMSEPRQSVDYLLKAQRINPASEMARKGMQWALSRLNQESLPTSPAQPILTPPEVSISHEAPPAQTQTNRKERRPSAFGRVAKYTALRGLALFASVCVSIFLIVYIANLGGYMDTIQKGLISENISGMLMGGWLKEIPLDQRQPIIDQTRAAMEASYGLDKPYIERTFNWFLRGISFNWGQSRVHYSIATEYYEGAFVREINTDDIGTIIKAYLPRTLVLFGVSNLGLFIVSIFIALPMALKPRKWTNRLIMWLAPTSSIPSWLVGIILLSLMYYVIGDFSYQLGYNSWSMTFDLYSVPKIFRSMLLPFLAIVFSKIFQSIYTLRNYFMLYSKEDYVELAVAKGLPARQLQSRYVLRPTLPTIVTNFVLILISIWQECIAVEYFFNIGGIGGYFMQALHNNDTMSIVALVATFAYFLAAAVFILDIVYAVIDPRVKIGETQQIEKKSHGLIIPPALRRLFGKKETGYRYGNTPATERISLGRKIQLLPIRVKAALTRRWDEFRGFINTWNRELKQYPSVALGLWMILILAVISIMTVTVMPYNKAISLWRGDDKVWIRNPKEAPPAWTNFFCADKKPETIDLYSQNLSASQRVESIDTDGNRHVVITFPFDYPYTSLPQDIVIMFTTYLPQKQPFVQLTWITPDGREVPMSHFGVSKDSVYYLSQDTKIALTNKNKSQLVELFMPADGNEKAVQKGKYQIRMDFTLFDEQTNVDAELIVYGQVYGLAGTDGSKRDLTVNLLWGLAVALSFGILAAVGTTLTSVMLAAIGAWFGGWVDGLIQRITEINMVMPMLPVAIMIFYLYSKSFWVILGVTVGLSIFGNQVKNYRSMFLQVMQLPYIEAAVAYGAPSWRIIFQYMIPRIRNVIIPQLMILVPSYVFFEATLTFLGVSDPSLPTLGKLLFYIFTNGGIQMPAYMILETVFVFLLISVGFVFIGYGLEQSYNDKVGM
jgi:peptide/nickel transport system permease protein